jgi:hypothetical protein
MMSEWLLWDRNAKSVAIGSPFPSEEDALAHAARLAAGEDGQDRPNRTFAVVEVPDVE